MPYSVNSEDDLPSYSMNHHSRTTSEQRRSGVEHDDVAIEGDVYLPRHSSTLPSVRIDLAFLASYHS